MLKFIIYAFGVFSYFYSQDQYAATLVSLQTLLIIGVVTGLISSLILERNYVYYIFTIVLFGSLFTAIFLKLNSSFADKKEGKVKVRILSKALKSVNTEHSHVTIEYNDIYRDIEIDRLQEYLLANSVFMELTVKKGGLGYDIITYSELVK